MKKKFLILTLLLIAIVTIINLYTTISNADTSVTTESLAENYSAKTYIDNPIDGNISTVKESITINGWYMSNDINAKINVYIDNEKQEVENIYREERTDVISVIKGYGGIEENPTPGYSIKLDIKNITNGNHILKIEIESNTGEKLTSDTRIINVQNYRASTYVEYPQETIENYIEGRELIIKGWVMTDDVNSQIKVYIDGKEQNILEIERFERQDVINIIKGYGTKEQNPNPGYALKINLLNLNDGKHSIEVKIVSVNGDILSTSTRKINIEKYSAKIYIESPEELVETNIENSNFTIKGWLMTNDVNAKIKVYIDGNEQKILEIERLERQDVTNIIKGYGGIEKNPTPGFKINLDLLQIRDGRHEITIKILSEVGEELTKKTGYINVNKYKATMYLDTPRTQEIVKPVVTLSGWIMSTDEQITINTYIDNKKQTIKNITKITRTDVISAIKGYGGTEKNPTPGFEITLDLSKILEGMHDLKIEIVSQEGIVLATSNRSIKIEKYRANMYIDSPSELEQNDGTLKVKGWVMSDDELSQIRIVIDGKEQEIAEIKRLERLDVTNTIKGYGEIEQNPTPGFELTLDLFNLIDGKHYIEVQIISRNGENIISRSRIVELNKYKSISYIESPTTMSQSKLDLVVEGWIMSTDEKASINIYLNDKKMPLTEITRSERLDVINTIKEYGTKEQNPNPGFKTQLDISQLDDGKYTLKLEIVSREGKIMSLGYREIIIYNNYDFGIDVSRYNGKIDWAKVKKFGIDFAIIRAGFRGYGTEGTLNEDTYFATNMKGAIQNGIDVGVYFYSQAITEIEAIQEAEMTLDLIKKYGFENDIILPIVIDTEKSSGRADNLTKEQRTIIVKTFCERIEQEGYKTMIYSNKYWLENSLDMEQLEQYDVWLAHYTGTDDPINNPSSYKEKYQIWQYTDVGKVDGINANVDMNISYKKYVK